MHLSFPSLFVPSAINLTLLRHYQIKFGRKIPRARLPLPASGFAKVFRFQVHFERCPANPLLFLHVCRSILFASREASMGGSQKNTKPPCELRARIATSYLRHNPVRNPRMSRITCMLDIGFYWIGLAEKLLILLHSYITFAYVP